MSALAAMLVAHGPRLLLGVTCVLGLGAVWTALLRDPAARRRSGLWTAGLSALYLATAAVPLPRFAIADAPTAASPAPGGANLAAALRVLGGDDMARSTAASAPASSAPTTSPSATPPAPPTAAAASIWPQLAVAGYGLGCAVAAAFWLCGACRLTRILRRARPTAAPFALPVGTRLFATDAAIRPFCCGIVRPRIVVPRTLLGAGRGDQLTAVLRHEAAHAAARDPLAQALLAALGIVLWCHPLFWWLCADVRFQAELCADDRAAANRRTAYARELLDLADDAGPHTAVPGTVAVFRRPSDFTRRIQMLLQPKTASPLPPSRLRRAAQALSLCALTAAAASTLGVPLPAQDPQRAAVQAECDKLRDEIAQLKNELAQFKARMASGSLVEVTEAVVPASAPSATTTGAAATPQPAGVPVLSQVPIVNRLFTKDPTATTPVPAGTPAAPLDTFQSANPFQPAGTSQAADGTSLEATADLTSRVIDLDSEIDVTRTELERLRPMAEAGVASQTDVRKAEVRLKALERKKAIVQKLVRGEIEATEAEIQWLLRRKKEGDKTEDLRLDSLLRRAAAKLDALRAVN